MTRFIKCLKVIALALLVVGAFAIASEPTALAQRADVCQGVTIAGGSCDAGTGNTQITGLVRTVINVLSLLGGIAAVIVIIISGFRLIVSAGDADGLKTARNGVIYAIVGLIIIAFAQAIVRFVLGRV